MLRKYGICGKTDKVRGESGEETLQSTGCSLVSLAFLYLGHCLVTPNKPITFQSTLEVLGKLNEKTRVGRLNHTYYLLEQMKEFVACCWELVPPYDMGFNKLQAL